MTVLTMELSCPTVGLGMRRRSTWDKEQTRETEQNIGDENRRVCHEAWSFQNDARDGFNFAAMLAITQHHRARSALRSVLSTY